MLTASNSFALGAEVFAGLAFAVFAVIAAGRLFGSARLADEHVKAGIAFAPAPAVPRATAVPREPVGSTVAPAAPPAPARDGFTRTAPAADLDSPALIFAQLNAYYAANISQGNTIFWASLLSMSLGFAVIFFGAIVAQGNGVTTIVVAIAGVVSQFIAATFLVALRSTQQQATAYAQTLVELRLRDVRAAADAQAVTLGLRLLDEISGGEADRLADQTRAALAMNLVGKDSGPSPVATPIEPVVFRETGDSHPPGSDAGDRRFADRERVRSVTFDDRAAASEPQQTPTPR